MQNVKDLILHILANGEERETRSGTVISTWANTLEWDLQKGFPAVTSKKLMWNAVVGELLWFLSGSTDISDLRSYTFGKDEEQWTIWSDDAKRWYNSSLVTDPGWPHGINFVGELYPTQWRNYNNEGVDQIQNLIHSLTTDMQSRYHIVMAWNPAAIARGSMALPPCHMGFQCYVTNNGELNLEWTQRSVDSGLGLPFNIASYALLTHLLAGWTGLKVGKLSCRLMDTHVYKNHLEGIDKYLTNPTHELPRFEMPDGGNSSIDYVVRGMTALDFADALVGYKHEPAIKMPLSVG